MISQGDQVARTRAFISCAYRSSTSQTGQISRNLVIREGHSRNILMLESHVWGVCREDFNENKSSGNTFVWRKLIKCQWDSSVLCCRAWNGKNVFFCCDSSSWSCNNKPVRSRMYRRRWHQKSPDIASGRQRWINELQTIALVIHATFKPIKLCDNWVLRHPHPIRTIMKNYGRGWRLGKWKRKTRRKNCLNK